MECCICQVKGTYFYQLHSPNKMEHFCYESEAFKQDYLDFYIVSISTLKNLITKVPKNLNCSDESHDLHLMSLYIIITSRLTLHGVVRAK